MRLWRWLFVAVILFGAWQHWQNRPMKSPPGTLAPADPVQTGPSSPTIYRTGKYELEPLADFVIEARALSKSIYHADRESELAPVDLALGWGGDVRL